MTGLPHSRPHSHNGESIVVLCIDRLHGDPDLCASEKRLRKDFGNWNADGQEGHIVGLSVVKFQAEVFVLVGIWNIELWKDGSSLILL